MKVILKRNFFANGFRYRKGTVDLPEDLRDKLPKDAVVVEAERPRRGRPPAVDVPPVDE